jgi:hypothetical protein
MHRPTCTGCRDKGPEHEQRCISPTSKIDLVTRLRIAARPAGVNMLYKRVLSNQERGASTDEKSDAVLQQIHSLRKEDETLSNILAIDIWALAKTMDEFQPGFWSEFMKNRQQSLKRFMSEVVHSKPVDIRRPPFLR